MRWMLLSTVVFGASGLIMGALNAMQHFLLPAAAPVLYNLAIIGGAWFLAPRYGVYGLVIGVVAGALAHLLVQIPGLWRYGARYTPSLSWRDPGVREVARLMGPRVLGLFFVQMHFLVNTILASRLAPGSLERAQLCLADHVAAPGHLCPGGGDRRLPHFCRADCRRPASPCAAPSAASCARSSFW